jgi:hypothetical protein
MESLPIRESGKKVILFRGLTRVLDAIGRDRAKLIL